MDFFSRNQPLPFCRASGSVPNGVSGLPDPLQRQTQFPGSASRKPFRRRQHICLVRKLRRSARESVDSNRNTKLNPLHGSITGFSTAYQFRSRPSLPEKVSGIQFDAQPLFPRLVHTGDRFCITPRGSAMRTVPFSQRGWHLTIVSAACLAVFLVPIFWMISTALKPISEIFANPPRLVPKEID